MQKSSARKLRNCITGYSDNRILLALQVMLSALCGVHTRVLCTPNALEISDFNGMSDAGTRFNCHTLLPQIVNDKPGATFAAVRLAGSGSKTIFEMTTHRHERTTVRKGSR